MFVDEMRYGLMSNIRRSWPKKGERTVYQNQQEFANRYLYTAIDPINGKSFHLMNFDDASTEQTDLFLSALQEKFPNDHLVIVWDRAPFHRSQSLKRKHMTLISLPSYSPQLNLTQLNAISVKRASLQQIKYFVMEWKLYQKLSSKVF